MTTKEFIEKYNKATDKELLLKNMINRSYVPYSEKIADCINIVRKSNEENLNSPLQFMLYAYNIITKYTLLELDEGQNILNFFESLEEINMINGLMSFIPENELTSYQTILNMCNDDYIENNRSLTAFLETKFGALKLSTDTLLEVLDKYSNNNE